MPYTKKSKAPRRRMYRRKPRVPRSVASRNPDVAGCTDTLATLNVSANTMYSLQNIALTNSSRAKTIAQGYQFYRINKVEIKWKPYVDTFTNASALSVPTLYFMVDKSNTFPTTATLDTLKQAGAKPIRFDDKVITRSLKPAVQIASSDSGPSGPAPVLETAGLLKVSPWITTSANAGKPGPWAPNSVDHRGCLFYVEQISANPQAGVGTVEVVIHYQFKKPLWVTPEQADETVHKIDLDTMTIVPPSVEELKSA